MNVRYVPLIANRGVRTVFGLMVVYESEAAGEGPKDVHVVFIGFGSLERSITECSWRHTNIHFHDAVPHEQAVSLVRRADAAFSQLRKRRAERVRSDITALSWDALAARLTVAYQEHLLAPLSVGPVR